MQANVFRAKPVNDTMKKFETLAHRRSAFSLIELIVVLGTISLMIGLIVPSLADMRERAWIVRSLANVRECGTSLQLYATDRNDLPPVIYPPIYRRFRVDPLFEVVVRDRTLRGFWFSEAFYWHTVLDPYLPGETLRSPLQRRRSPLWADGLQTDLYTDYALARCFYAEPAYWNRTTNVGPSQWAAQGFWKVRAPSSKGMFYDQAWHYAVHQQRETSDRSFRTRRAAAVLWADHSATAEDLWALKPGIIDYWSPYNWFLARNASDGQSIAATVNGVYGVDR